MTRDGQGGFTLIELLVAITVLSVATTAFYQMLFSSTEGSERSQEVVRTSEEARMGFNRLVRDTREASEILDPTATSYTVKVDFNGNGTPEPVPTDPTGNYEVVTFTFNPGTEGNGTITLTAGTQIEVLMSGVDCIRKADDTCHDVFSFRSSRLQYDANGDGVTSGSPLGGELDDAPQLGNGNDILDGQELSFVDVVSYAFRVLRGASDGTFYADAQLRNRR